MRLRLPDPAARPAVVGLTAVWLGVVFGRLGWWPAGLIVLLLAPIQRVLGRGNDPGRASLRANTVVVVAALLAGILAGSLSLLRERAVWEAALPTGTGRVAVTALTDAKPSRYRGSWFLARPYGLWWRERWIDWVGPPLLVSGKPLAIDAGARLLVVGRWSPRPGVAGGTPYSGRLAARQIQVLAAGSHPLLTIGNALRHRVIDRLTDRGAPSALLAGLLVGATDQLPEGDVEALRRAGISHFVAVSGSNVAGFLLLWYLVLGPLGVGARRRGLIGLLAVAVFAVATRWEPSVLRACLMAALVLAGRVAGIPVDSWAALGWSASLGLLVSPELAGDLGFQLSVLATGGILAGSDLLPARLPNWLRRSLGPSLAAQAAVTPLLLVRFGEVPAISPVANLVSAPLVALATLTGGIGTLAGFEPLVSLATGLSGLVLDLAHRAAGFPQVGPVGVVMVLAAVALGQRRRLRPALALALAVGVAWWLVPPAMVRRPALIFLDVGQGDAALLLATDGRNVLIDAGPDPVVLATALRRYAVTRLDLVVLTHPHDDHVGGLEGLLGRIPIQRLWIWGTHHTGPAWSELAPELGTLGLIGETPVVGWTETFEGFQLKVLGPERRYEGTNDQSIVLMVTSPSHRVLMTGDVEVTAQRELGPIVADILKVPHHGGATSDPVWLAATGADLAIISVGENDYGHPHPFIVATLAGGGATVVRTDQAGDVVVSLGLALLLVGRSLRTIDLAEQGEDVVDTVRVARMGGHRHPHVLRADHASQLAAQIFRNDPGSLSGRLRQNQPDEVMISPPGMGDVIGRADPRGEPGPEFAQGRALPSGGELCPGGSGEVGHHERKDLLVSIGSSHFNVGSFQDGAGVADPGLVVDLVVQFEFLQAGPYLLDRPPPAQSEHHITADPGTQLPEKRTETYELDRGPAQGQVSQTRQDPDKQTPRGPEEQKSGEHRDEKQRAGYLHRIHTPGQRHQGHHSDQDQTGHEEQGSGAVVGERQRTWHGRSVWSRFRDRGYHREDPCPISDPSCPAPSPCCPGGPLWSLPDSGRPLLVAWPDACCELLSGGGPTLRRAVR